MSTVDLEGTSVLPSGTPDMCAEGGCLSRTLRFSSVGISAHEDIQELRTGPGPGYRVSSHVGSETWISKGLIRTIGPHEHGQSTISTFLNRHMNR